MIPLALFLLACAAVYVGTIETAFSALMQLSLRLGVERSAREGGLGRYLEDPILLFVPVRLLLSLIVALAMLLAAEFTGLTGPRAAIVLLVTVGAFTIAFEHLIPLLIIRRDPEQVLSALLPSFNVVAAALQPITRTLVGIIGVFRREHPPHVPAPVHEEEASEAAQGHLEAHEPERSTDRDERQLLQSIVEFGDALVREVMTPRPDVVAISEDASLEELRALFREQEYSRIPVYEDSLDQIKGFVFVKDLIQLTEVAPDVRLVPTLMRPVYFVPETKRVPELLKEFQRHQVQIAIVVDEYGGTAGLVTLEDLLEEIVGEIRDEYDVESEPILEEGNGAFVVSGKAAVDKVAERLNVEIARGDFETVGGYLMAHLGRVPAVGEAFDLDGLHVQVLEAERRRITKVRLRRQAVAERAAE
jgi:CBS domain containing-hemolysin-like protein